jgi:hypothetical protein
VISLKLRHRPERSQRIVGRLLHRAIGAGLPADPIQQDPLTIEPIEGAKAEVAVFEQITNGDAALIDPLHQGAGGGNLINGVMLEVQGFSQGLTHHMARTFTGAPTALLESSIQPITEAHMELVVGIRTACHRNRSLSE